MSSIEPVAIKPFADAYEAASLQETDETKTEGKEERLSVYYITTLASLQKSETLTDQEINQANQETKALENQSQTSTLRKWGEWVMSFLWSWSPKSQTQPTNQAPTKVEGIPSLGGPPKLQPEELDRKRLSRSIAELNRDLVHRLKETNEFEEEMRKSGSKNIDKLIFAHLFEMGLKQKKSKEDLSIESQEEILRKHKENKKLQQDFFSIWDDVKERSKKSAFLGWINMGATIGITGLFAVSFATGGTGAIIMLALPLLSIVQGTTKAAEGIIKYQNDKKSGEMFLLKEKSSENSLDINTNLQDLKTNDQEMAQLLKALRHHLENQSKAERIFRGSAF